jgi:hypothetical protein
VFADPVPTILRELTAQGDDLSRAKVWLADTLTVDADEILRRWSELPDLKMTAAGPHVPLLLEARELYRHRPGTPRGHYPHIHPVAIIDVSFRQASFQTSFRHRVRVVGAGPPQ